jgi:hypothetical protein
MWKTYFKPVLTYVGIFTKKEISRLQESEMKVLRKKIKKN